MTSLVYDSLFFYTSYNKKTKCNDIKSDFISSNGREKWNNEVNFVVKKNDLKYCIPVTNFVNSEELRYRGTQNKG